MKQGDAVYGYIVKRIVELNEINSVLYEFEHTATGAMHIHVGNTDEENTFSVAFKTVPTDSTGAAHILEHTVLCGSEKFPVRDPFFSMLKRSLNTFMNAFTASDWTMYPFSTQNRKDFYNLMDVYLDAAYFPNLEELSFKQEGHRLAPENDMSVSDSHDTVKLEYKGIVYNEMKGAMSSPDQVMVRSILNALYPSTTYSYNSGGDPAEIPDLTHTQLKAFHQRHYHPGNAFFYTYGNLPVEDHLSFINKKILKNFDRIDPHTDVPAQPRWNEPKKVKYPYPLGKNEAPEKKYQFCVAWLTADIKDSFEILVLTILEQILIGNSASPMRKALIDSELGTSLSDGTGYDSENRDTLFACGLKDIKKSSCEKVEQIIFKVLNDLVENGIDDKMIASAIHQIEFHRKEKTNSPYPYGIKLLLTFSSSWFHGGDPVRILEFDDDLSRLQDELAKGPFLENRLKTYFLDNSHRVHFTLVPDQQMEKQEKKRVSEKLKHIKEQMSESEFGKIIADTRALAELQESDEDISSLPTLQLDDIPPSIHSVEETRAYGNVPASCFEQPTSGIFYFSAAIGAGNLPDKLIPFVPFFCSSFTRVGTSLHDYTEMAQLIDTYTGGVGLLPHARTSFKGEDVCLPFLSFDGKCLVRNQEKMFDIITELIGECDFSDLVRLKSLLLEYRAGMESRVVHNGHRLAISLSTRNFSITRNLDEIWHGIHQLQFIKKITDDLFDEKLAKKKLESISENLSLISNTLLYQNNFKMAVVGESHAIECAIPLTKTIQSSLRPTTDHPDMPQTPDIRLDNEYPREGWSTSSAVSFVANSFKTVRMGHKDAPALSVISKILKSMFLHREIREKGGAYGGFASYNPEDGIFCRASYRDPHILTTLQVFDAAALFIKSGKYSDEDIKEAILQVCSDIDRPDTPGVAARKSFYRKIISLTDEARFAYKKNLLSLDRKQVMEVAEKHFDQDQKKQGIAVISGEEKLKEANERIKGEPLKLYSI